MAFHPDQNLEGHPHKWGTMLAVSLSIFMATIDLSIVNVSLPTLVEQLNTDFATIQWVILSYVLMVTALMLSVARLGDIWGMKKIYITGQLVFTISSILCGLSPGVNWLIGFRALQGVGAVMTQSVGIGIVTAAFPASERGRAMGIVGGVVSVGLALGPALGGILIGLVGWRSVFLVNAPIGAAAITATLRYVTPTIHGRPGQKFDLAGAVVLFLTLTTYALGMTLGQRRGFGDLLVLFLLTSAAIGLVLFVLAEKYSAQPMVDPALFKNVLFTINLLMGFVVFLILAGSIVMPFFLECVKGWPTEKVGLMMMVVPVSMGLVAPVAGSMSDRYGSRVISLVGLLVVIGGCLSMSTLNDEPGAFGYCGPYISDGYWEWDCFSRPITAPSWGRSPGKDWASRPALWL